MSKDLAQEIDRYWKTVVNVISDGIMIVNPQGEIVAVNRAFERITGFSQPELLGRTCRILRCDVCEGMLEREGEHYCRLFRGGEVSQRQCVIHQRDGTVVHALKNATLLRDDDGAVLGAVETITDISEIVEKENELEAARRELRARDGFQGIIGTSAPMQRVFALIQSAAQSDAPVILYGESGTGKELVSQAIHDLGERSDRPFVKINCASLTESLLESELFGHVRGAFTGAIRDRVGRFEQAHGGDLFLDEIGDLPLATQTKLLRVLEDKFIERVGDNRQVRADVRLISATNRDLRELVRSGAYREDFFFRINVVPIHLPPLRARREDIPLLAETFYRLLRNKSGRPIEGLSRRAMDHLMQYRWPGNVRELRSALEYAFVTCQERLIQPEHLPATVLEQEPPQGGASLGAPPGAPPPASPGASPAAPPPASSARRVAGGRSRELERAELIDALERCGGNQTQAAKLLGVSRVTVWNRMKRHGVRAERKVEARQPPRKA